MGMYDGGECNVCGNIADTCICRSTFKDGRKTMAIEPTVRCEALVDNVARKGRCTRQASKLTAGNRLVCTQHSKKHKKWVEVDPVVRFHAILKAHNDLAERFMQSMRMVEKLQLVATRHLMDKVACNE